jgi:hypothetical protein
MNSTQRFSPVVGIGQPKDHSGIAWEWHPRRVGKIFIHLNQYLFSTLWDPVAHLIVQHQVKKFFSKDATLGPIQK